MRFRQPYACLGFSFWGRGGRCVPLPTTPSFSWLIDCHGGKNKNEAMTCCLWSPCPPFVHAYACVPALLRCGIPVALAYTNAVARRVEGKRHLPTESYRGVRFRLNSRSGPFAKARGRQQWNMTLKGDWGITALYNPSVEKRKTFDAAEGNEVTWLRSFSC